MVDTSQYLELFLEESQEQLQRLNQALLELEEKGFDPDLMNQAFSTVHTVKGTAAILGIEPDELEKDYPNVLDGARGMAFIESVVESSKSDQKWYPMKNFKLN